MQKSKEDIQKEKDDFLRQFVVPEGNIWGWKFSLFGLGLILFLSLWLAWLHYKSGYFQSIFRINQEIDIGSSFTKNWI